MKFDKKVLDIRVICFFSIDKITLFETYEIHLVIIDPQTYTSVIQLLTDMYILYSPHHNFWICHVTAFGIFGPIRPSTT